MRVTQSRQSKSEGNVFEHIHQQPITSHADTALPQPCPVSTAGSATETIPFGWLNAWTHNVSSSNCAYAELRNARKNFVDKKKLHIFAVLESATRAERQRTRAELFLICHILINHSQHRIGTGVFRMHDKVILQFLRHKDQEVHCQKLLRTATWNLGKLDEIAQRIEKFVCAPQPCLESNNASNATDSVKAEQKPDYNQTDSQQIICDFILYELLVKRHKAS